MMTEIFFVVGRGRSGTTLLSRMLGQHPQLAMAPEGFFLLNLQRKYRAGPWSERRVKAFCRDLVRENRMRSWGLDLGRLAARLNERRGRLTYTEACRLVYLSYAEDTLGRAAPKWIGDKNPHYALMIPRLQRVFPHARFVHITRDYRDNIHSYRGLPFDLANHAALAQRWKSYNQAILRASRRRPERFLWLRYEDLLAYPEHELGRICSFLGVELDRRMLDFHATADDTFYGRKSPWFDNLRKPLDPSQAGKGQQLPATAMHDAELICGAFGEGFGYHASANGSALPLRARAGAFYGWCSVQAEKALFGAAPVGLRTGLINVYRRLSGRV